MGEKFRFILFYLFVQIQHCIVPRVVRPSWGVYNLTISSFLPTLEYKRIYTFVMWSSNIITMSEKEKTDQSS